MKLYIAACYPRKLEMREYAKQLEAAGFTVTSRWIMEPEDPNVKLSECTVDRLIAIARYDLEDIDQADAMLFFAEDPEKQPPRGGRHVEFGFAIGTGKPVYVVGGYENVFHYVQQIHHVHSFEAFMDAIKPVYVHPPEK